MATPTIIVIRDGLVESVQTGQSEIIGRPETEEVWIIDYDTQETPETDPGRVQEIGRDDLGIGLKPPFAAVYQISDEAGRRVNQDEEEAVRIAAASLEGAGDGDGLAPCGCNWQTDDPCGPQCFLNDEDDGEEPPVDGQSGTDDWRDDRPNAPTRDSLIRALALLDMDENAGAEHEILGNFVGMAQGILKRELEARK